MRTFGKTTSVIVLATALLVLPALTASGLSSDPAPAFSSRGLFHAVLTILLGQRAQPKVKTGSQLDPHGGDLVPVPEETGKPRNGSKPQGFGDPRIRAEDLAWQRSGVVKK